MARRPRQAIAAHPYHVVQRGVDGRAVFVDDLDRRRWLEALREAADTHGLAVHAYAMTVDRVHLLATPRTDDALSLTMQALGRRYVRSFNARHGRSGTLFEGRFRSSLVEPGRWLLPCQRHVESSPVRAGLVAAPADWPWSSHRHHAGLAVDPLLRPHPAMWALGNTPFERESAYRRLFDEPVPPDERDWLDGCLRGGRPTASLEFQRRLESTAGLRLVPRPVGRPRKAASPDRAVPAAPGAGPDLGPTGA